MSFEDGQRPLLDALRLLARPALADLLARCGDMPLAEYSAQLHRHRPARPLEAALSRAFRAELGRSSLDPPAIEAVMSALEQNRVIQTGTHVTVSEGPFFFAMHALATLSLPRDTPYVYGVNRGLRLRNCLRSRRFQDVPSS